MIRQTAEDFIRRHQADEKIRRDQQGLGRPILSTNFKGHQVVAVGDKIFYSKSWKTFPDFLNTYIRQALGADWGNTELAKPLAERHQVMQWYDAYVQYQQETIKVPGEVTGASVTGLVACYLGLAYSLYLLAHNVELQARLLSRLRDPGNFQGAYYELMVANILIRAGFTLTLVDETDSTSKHCEFSVVSQATGKKYWVEAKMRAVSGVLGRTDADGTKSDDPLSHVNTHLNQALKKPASDERIIFVDVNAPYVEKEGANPAWTTRAARHLEKYEYRHKDASAYVFVTNLPFHRMLNDTPVFMAVPFGLGISDFNRPGLMRLVEAYRRKQKHIDAYNIGDALSKYAVFPTTFDGSLPSEKFGPRSGRIKIGETYFFENQPEGGVVGTVTSMTVDQAKRLLYFSVTTQDGRSVILREQMTEAAFDDYKAHPDAYFGEVRPPAKNISDPFELFEWFMQSYAKTPREKLLEFVKGAPHFALLSRLPDDELRAHYCELLVSSVQQRTDKTLPQTLPPVG